MNRVLGNATMVLVIALLAGCKCTCGGSSPSGLNKEPSTHGEGVFAGRGVLQAEVARRFAQDRSLESLSANCTQVTDLPDDDNSWFIRGYNPGVVLDEQTGEITAFWWYNANPSSPPDVKSQQCWGTFCHWVLASDVHYWTTAYTCESGTPGGDSVAFYAR